MKLHFLGTGAADWDIQNPRSDINYRRYSSLLIDGKLLVDPGPCIYEFASTFGYDSLFDDVSCVINTHRHYDHYNEDTLARLGLPLLEIADNAYADTGDYRITAYPANHATAESPQHFVIESKTDGKKIFYGCDGAWLLYPVWTALKMQHFDAMILDCTIGDKAGDYRIFEHNSIPMVEIMCQTLAPYSERFYVSHMARTLHTDHETLRRRLAPSGIIPAYDNMEVEI